MKTKQKKNTPDTSGFYACKRLCTAQSYTPLGIYICLYVYMYVCTIVCMPACMYNFPADFAKANIHFMLHWFIMLYICYKGTSH